MGEGVVAHADDLVQVEPRLARIARQLARPDELCVLVRATRQEVQHVLRANDREQERLRIAIDRREEDPAAGPGQGSAGGDAPGRIRHVLEHLHAGDDIEGGRTLLCPVFCGAFVIGNAGTAFDGVELGDLQGLAGHVDPRDVRSAGGHRLGQQAGATADIESALAPESCQAIDPGEANRVDHMQRPHRPVGIPPAGGHVAELAQLQLIDVSFHHEDVTSWRTAVS